MHILVTCSLAKSCWDVVGMNVISTEYQCFDEWLGAVLQMYKGKEARLKVTICWALWKARNEIVWNQKGGDYAEIISSANSMLNQWSSAQDKTFNRFLGLMTEEDGDEHWTLPTEDKVKLNTDAAIFVESNCYSFVLVARNHRGEVIDVVVKCKAGKVDPAMAEIMGIREALSWVKAQQGSGVTIETDSLVCVQAIRSSSVNLSYLGRMVEDCRNLLVELKDREVSLRFVRRSANKVAHFIARNSSSLAGRNWHGDSTHPDFISVIKNDLKV